MSKREAYIDFGKKWDGKNGKVQELWPVEKTCLRSLYSHYTATEHRSVGH